MSILSRLKGVEAKFAWSILGVFLAIVFGVFTLYPVFHKDKPAISINIINEANVLDIHKPLEDLNISFQGEDIQQKNLNLRIFTVRIMNNGQVDILQNFYDSDDVWGLQVENGRIIESRFVDSNSDYIREKINPQMVAKENIVHFSKIIFEKQKFFILEILVLHAKEQTPNIISLGKIAGIDKIEVKATIEGEDKGSFFNRVIEGNAGVHTVRAIGYFISFIIIAAIIIFTVIGFTELIDYFKKKARRNKARIFAGLMTPTEGIGQSKLLDLYVKSGPEILGRIQILLENENKIRSRIKSDRKMKKVDKVRYRELERGEFADIYTHSHDIAPLGIYYTLLPELVKDGLIKLGEKDEVIIDSEFKDSLKKLIELLEKEKKVC